MQSMEVTVGPKGRIVIPKPIRDRLGIAAGDEVRFRTKKGKIIIEPEDPRELLERFLNAYEKRSLPSGKDWDEQAGKRHEERFFRASGGS